MSKEKIRLLANVLLGFLTLAAAGIVVFIFFLLTNIEYRNPLSWLNLGITVWIIVLNGVVFLIVLNSLKKNIGALAVLLTSETIVAFYSLTVTVLVLISASITYEADLWKNFLSYHLIALFFFLLGETLIFLATLFSGNVSQKEQEQSQGLDSIKNKTAQLHIKVNMLQNEFQNIKNAFASFADDLKYISPNPSKEAQDLEEQIGKKLNFFAIKIDGLTAMEDATENEKLASEHISLIQKMQELAQMRDKVLSD